MFARIVTALLLIAAVAVIVPARTVSGGSSSIQDQNSLKVKEKIRKIGTGEKAKVTVKLHNQTSYKGYVRAARDTDFDIIDRAGGLHTVSYSDVRSVGGGGGLSGAAKLAIGIGIGVGAVLAVLFAIAQSDD